MSSFLPIDTTSQTASTVPPATVPTANADRDLDTVGSTPCAAPFSDGTQDEPNHPFSIPDAPGDPFGHNHFFRVLARGNSLGHNHDSVGPTQLDTAQNPFLAVGPDQPQPFHGHRAGTRARGLAHGLGPLRVVLPRRASADEGASEHSPLRSPLSPRASPRASRRGTMFSAALDDGERAHAARPSPLSLADGGGHADAEDTARSAERDGAFLADAGEHAAARAEGGEA